MRKRESDAASARLCIHQPVINRSNYKPTQADGSGPFCSRPHRFPLVSSLLMMALRRTGSLDLLHKQKQAVWMAKRIEFRLEHFASPINIDFLMTNSWVKCVFSRLFSVGLLCRFSMLPKVLFCLMVKILPPWLPFCPILSSQLYDLQPNCCRIVAQHGQLYSAGNDAVPRSHPSLVPQGIPLLRSNALIKHYAVFLVKFDFSCDFICHFLLFVLHLPFGWMCAVVALLQRSLKYAEKNLKPVRVTIAR